GARPAARPAARGAGAVQRRARRVPPPPRSPQGRRGTAPGANPDAGGRREQRRATARLADEQARPGGRVARLELIAVIVPVVDFLLLPRADRPAIPATRAVRRPHPNAGVGARR